MPGYSRAKPRPLAKFLFENCAQNVARFIDNPVIVSLVWQLAAII